MFACFCCLLFKLARVTYLLEACTDVLIKICMFQWSPDKSSVFGSSAEDGILNIWDHDKVRNPFLISFLSFLFLADYMLKKFFYLMLKIKLLAL